jgi:hypothetical protein
MNDTSVRIDLRAILSITALAIVVLVIIFVQICGNDDVPALVEQPGSPAPETDTPQPEGPTNTPGPTLSPEPAVSPTPSVPAPGGDERDATRQQDLLAVQQALEEYQDEEGSYPDTDNNVQSLCVFDDTDQGCQLRDFIDPIPVDPLGEPIPDNGYWYASDGARYTVFAQRESDTVPECPEHPDHLARIDSLQCVQGP